ncbi:nucleoside hydrolase [Aestuariibacter salexigens]|uniref:nucleoside hydrolase n=1 Tax=Aestuariibacter salexigens TaxID=226010 RepID=UPI000412682F|nr:nucleoside hydrolase [Aestuariibacter salexigens]
MKKVLFDHDGGIDDLLSLMLLLSSPDIELIGITVTPADCYADEALRSTLKLCGLFGKTDIPVAVGDLHGINAFPAEWRAQPKMCNALPAMLRVDAKLDQLDSRPASELISSLLEEAVEPITVLMTGPCSNLNAALDDSPQAHAKIEEVVWMAGALKVRGNVAMHNHDGSAEWNVFWDPVSAKQLLSKNLPLTLVPLDATNAFPVSMDFLASLATLRSSQVADLAGQMWAATVTSLPSYEYTYFMWDVLATCCVLPLRQHMRFTDKKIDVLVSDPSAGQTTISANGTQVSVLERAEKEAVLAGIIELFDKNFVTDF